MQPTGDLLKSAHTVDREFRVMTALVKTDVPVPQMLHLCNDVGVFGRLFFLMRYQPGRVIWDPRAPQLNRSERVALHAEMNRVLASLHSVDVNAVGLSDFGRAGNYYQRQIQSWSKQYKASETQVINPMDELIEWLPENLPEEEGQVSLIHGDYGIDNIMSSQSGTDAVALLDWELSTLGHPYADIAYQCMQWHLATNAVKPGLAGDNCDDLGIPSDELYVEQYCQNRNVSGVPNWSFYLAFSFFALPPLYKVLKKRTLDGNASSPKAFAYGALAPVLTQLRVDALEHG